MGRTHSVNPHRYANQSPTTMHRVVHGGDFTSGLGTFASAIGNRQVATGTAYYGKASKSTLESFIPNFSDSMSSLDPDSDDFNQDLYDVLTSKEKQTLQDDKGFKFWDLAYAVPFIGLYQDTREGWDEMTGSRHPEILENAVERYNKKLKVDEAQRQADQKKKEMDYMQKKMAETLREELQGKIGNRQYMDTIPVVNEPVGISNIPIDVTRGRGFGGLPVQHLFDQQLERFHPKRRHQVVW